MAVSCPESQATTEHQLVPLSCERISPRISLAQFCDLAIRINKNLKRKLVVLIKPIKGYKKDRNHHKHHPACLRAQQSASKAPYINKGIKSLNLRP